MKRLVAVRERFGLALENGASAATAAAEDRGDQPALGPRVEALDLGQPVPEDRHRISQPEPPRVPGQVDPGFDPALGDDRRQQWAVGGVTDPAEQVVERPSLEIG